MTDRCPVCGQPLDVDTFEIMSAESAVPVDTITIRRCCEPSPTAAQMARQADDEWLARQRRLVEMDDAAH